MGASSFFSSPALLEKVKATVLAVSNIRVETNLLIARHLERLFAEEKPLPDISRAFVERVSQCVSSPRLNLPKGELAVTVTEYFRERELLTPNNEVPKRPPGNANGSMCRDYAKDAKQVLQGTLFGRTKKLIALELRDISGAHGPPYANMTNADRREDGLVRRATFRLLGWNRYGDGDNELPATLLEALDEGGNGRGSGEGDWGQDCTWNDAARKAWNAIIDKHRKQYAAKTKEPAWWHYHVLKQLETCVKPEDFRAFSPVPAVRVGAVSVEFDTRTLVALLPASELGAAVRDHGDEGLREWAVTHAVPALRKATKDEKRWTCRVSKLPRDDALHVDDALEHYVSPFFTDRCDVRANVLGDGTLLIARNSERRLDLRRTSTAPPTLRTGRDAMRLLDAAWQKEMGYTKDNLASAKRPLFPWAPVVLECLRARCDEGKEVDPLVQAELRKLCSKHTANWLLACKRGMWDFVVISAVSRVATDAAKRFRAGKVMLPPRHPRPGGVATKISRTGFEVRARAHPSLLNPWIRTDLLNKGPWAFDGCIRSDGYSVSVTRRRLVDLATAEEIEKIAESDAVVGRILKTPDAIASKPSIHAVSKLRATPIARWRKMTAESREKDAENAKARKERDKKAREKLADNPGELERVEAEMIREKRAEKAERKAMGGEDDLRRFHPTKAQKKEAGVNGFTLPQSKIPDIGLRGKRAVVIDTGRHWTLYGVVLQDGSPVMRDAAKREGSEAHPNRKRRPRRETVELRTSEWHELSGHGHAKRAMVKLRKAAHQHVRDTADTPSAKTTGGALERLRHVLPRLGEVMKFACSDKVLAVRMNAYSSEQRALAEIVRRVVAGAGLKSTVVIVGDGLFSSVSAGHAPGPIVKILRHLHSVGLPVYRMSEYMTSQMCPCCVDEWESGGSDWNNPPPRLERMTQRRLDFNCAVLCPHKELLREALKHRRAEKLHKKRKEERRRREERDRKRQEAEGAKKVSKRVTVEKVKRDAMEVDFDGKVAVRETEDGEAAPRVTAKEGDKEDKDDGDVEEGEDMETEWELDGWFDVWARTRAAFEHETSLPESWTRVSPLNRVLRCTAHAAQVEQGKRARKRSLLLHRDLVGALNLERSFLHAHANGGKAHPLFARPLWQAARERAMRSRPSRKRRGDSGGSGSTTTGNTAERASKRSRRSPTGQTTSHLRS
jgi:hypothetical protein